MMNNQMMRLTNAISTLQLRGLTTKTWDKPKAPMTTFFTFLGEKRPVYKKNFPELWPKQSVIVKKVAEEWRVVPENKKTAMNSVYQVGFS